MMIVGYHTTSVT